MIEKYYVRQNFSSIDLITVKQHPLYETLYEVCSSFTGISNVPKSLCFDTRREAINRAVCRLISNKKELTSKICRIEVKLNKLQKLEGQYQKELDE